MATEDLKDIRLLAGYTQDAAMQLISAASGGKVSVDRRRIISAEKGGTRDLFLLEGMAAVYDVPFSRIREANLSLLKSAGFSVQKISQFA